MSADVHDTGEPVRCNPNIAGDPIDSMAADCPQYATIECDIGNEAVASCGGLGAFRIGRGAFDHGISPTVNRSRITGELA